MEDRITILESRVDSQAELITNLVDSQSELISRLLNQIKQLKRAGAKHEDYYQKLLEVQLSAGPMTIPGVGRTDITTATQHIEIKRWGRYHEVPGQLAKYQMACPRRHLVAYFFGMKPGHDRLKDIRAFMQAHKIKMYSFDEDDEIVDYNRNPLGSLTAPTASFREWFHMLVEPDAIGRVHAHAIADAYNKMSSEPNKTTRLITNYLIAMDLKVTDDPKRAVPPCHCRNPNRCVLGYRFRDDA